MRTAVLQSLVIATLPLLAGCLGGTEAPQPEATGQDAAGVMPDVSALEVDGANARQLLYDFAMGHPDRRADSPGTMAAARAYLTGALEAAGLEVVSDAYRETGTNILGIHRGLAQPDQWVVLSCHYDTIRSTVYGARDDGLGCAVLLEFAATLAQTSWNRTIVLAFFDEEESGLIGSQAFVQQVIEDANTTVVFNLNFDPAGLHWPCGDAAGQYPVHLMITRSKVEGPEAVPGYAPLLAAVLHGFSAAGVPDQYVNVASRHAYLVVGDNEYLPPGSDDDSFDQFDIPSIWVGAPPTDQVGPVRAWGYPNHTPPDTAHLVEARCGSATLLEEGLQVAMDATVQALLVLDATAVAPA